MTAEPAIAPTCDELSPRRDGPIPLPSPAELRRRLPLTPAGSASIDRARGAIRDVLHGRDRDRLVAVVGPCSIHDEASALEFAARLRPLARELDDALVLVMRTYFEKPRTTIGWKGLLLDPALDGSQDARTGLRTARRLLVRLAEAGVACGTEWLSPFAPAFLGDTISWGCVGARTAESQTHRELASGLDHPVGFKNGTDGRIATALAGARAAAARHPVFTLAEDGGAALLETTGNPDGHVVLRGGVRGPNHDPESVAAAARATRELGVARGVFVDCSHDNSRFEPSRQIEVCHSVGRMVRAGFRELGGVLLESHLEGGRQDHDGQGPPSPSLSLTDPCLGFEDTAETLRALARSVRG